MAEVEEGNRATLIERIRALAPTLLPAAPQSSAAELRRMLAELEAQRDWYASAGLVDEAE